MNDGHIYTCWHGDRGRDILHSFSTSQDSGTLFPWIMLNWEPTFCRAQQDQLYWRKEQNNNQSKNKTSHRHGRCSLWHWNTLSNSSSCDFVLYSVRERTSRWGFNFSLFFFLSLCEMMKRARGGTTAGGGECQEAKQTHTHGIRSQGFSRPAGVTVVICLMSLCVCFTQRVIYHNKRHWTSGLEVEDYFERKMSSLWPSLTPVMCVCVCWCVLSVCVSDCSLWTIPWGQTAFAYWH